MIGKNNLLNIRTSAHFNWNGQTGATKGFCDFESTEACRRVGAYLLMKSYRRAKVQTIHDIIFRFAPPSENQSGEYVAFVCKWTGFKPTDKMVFPSDYAAVLAAMEMMEQGISSWQRVSYFKGAREAYAEVMDKFKLYRYED